MKKAIFIISAIICFASFAEALPTKIKCLNTSGLALEISLQQQVDSPVEFSEEVMPSYKVDLLENGVLSKSTMAVLKENSESQFLVEGPGEIEGNVVLAGLSTYAGMTEGFIQMGADGGRITFPGMSFPHCTVE